ncbi:hypothetical protein FACS189430_03550 [Bacteroidia bacterium]|nr:hypothetical protein FACS189430_03550 [Bacteroidia bacterium]
MKMKMKRIILIGIAGCLLIVDIYLLHLHRQDQNRIEVLHKNVSKVEHLREIEFSFAISKELTVTRFKHEQYSIGNADIYIGSDKNTHLSLQNIVKRPKLVFGTNQNMCSPCIYGVLDELKIVFPDYEKNPDIIYIADIEERFKDNYFDKKVISFLKKGEFPLYELGMPYLFILDKDLVVKMLFITDKTSPELTMKPKLNKLKELIN